MQKYFVTSKSNKHVERLLENILLFCSDCIITM